MSFTTAGTSWPLRHGSIHAIITKEKKLYIDVNLDRGPFYGDTLSWTDANKPALDLQLVHVQTDLDLPRFNKLFIDLMKAPPQTPSGFEMTLPESASRHVSFKMRF